MVNYKNIALFGVIGFQIACSSHIAEKDISALISEPTDESRAELVSVVSGALDNAKITLADDALVNNSQLIITRKQHKTIQDGVLLGRSYELPEHFNLVINTERCFLVRQKTGERWTLKQTRCVVKEE